MLTCGAFDELVRFCMKKSFKKNNAVLRFLNENSFKISAVLRF